MIGLGPNVWSVKLRKNENFRHLLLYEFNRGSKAAEAAGNIFSIYRENSIAERRAQKLFARFKQGNFEMSGTSCSGRHLMGYGGDCPL
jgi:hypothetical protein